ncbi:MAG: serine/threonine-protein kinase, partial [Nannocystaceae bacterium]
MPTQSHSGYFGETHGLDTTRRLGNDEKSSLLPPPGFTSGDVVGRYVVLSTLGAGAMGVVYAAYDPELDRKVAIKLVRPEHTRKDETHRLLREAQALAKLAHPNVVGVHDVGTINDRVWLALEFIEGQTLRSWLSALRTRPRSWQAILKVMQAAGEGLAAAHDAGLLHRDFKPDNVMVGDDGRVRVMDLGLARLAGEARPGSAVEMSHQDSPLQLDLTQAGALLGTPG